MREVVLDKNPTCRAAGKTAWLPKSTRKLHTSCKDWEIRKQSWPTRCSNFGTEDKAPFLSLFLDSKGSRAGRIPNSRGSTSTLEVRQEEKFRWTQVRSAFLKKHKGGKDDSTKSYEILSRKAARLHMDPCRFIERSIQIEQPGQTRNVDPATNRHPMKGHVQERKAISKQKNGTCLLFEAGVLYFLVPLQKQRHPDARSGTP